MNLRKTMWVTELPSIAGLRLGIWIRCILLLMTLAPLVLPDQISEEKLHCTADSCDANGEDSVLEVSEDESESGVHLAFNCVSPESVPEEEVPVIMLHGLTDTRKTWNGIYQNIPILTHRKTCIFDARNHGDSGWMDNLSVDALAEDLGHFMNKLKIERAVLVGHSMGGLTAMKFALNNPNKVDGLFLEDISPVTMPDQATALVIAWINLLQNSISVIPKDADEITAKKTVADYILQATHESPPESFSKYTPIHQRDGVWQWKTNFGCINKMFEDFDSFFAENKGRYDGKAFFLYGKSSLFKVGDQEQEIRQFFPNSQFFGIEGAGHVIHDRHPEFMTKLIKFLE